MRINHIVQPGTDIGRGDIPKRDYFAKDRFADKEQVVHPVVPGNLPIVHAIRGNSQSRAEHFAQRAVYDYAEGIWLKNFLAHWLANDWSCVGAKFRTALIPVFTTRSSTRCASSAGTVSTAMSG